MEKEYTYILTIGDKVVKPVAVGWWSTEEDMVTTRCGMAIAARAFRKTAGILVYEKEKDSIVNYDSSLHYVLSVWMFAKGTICR